MDTIKRIVVIGGSAAGPKAAARARRLDENASITIIQKDPDPVSYTHLTLPTIYSV